MMGDLGGLMGPSYRSIIELGACNAALFFQVERLSNAMPDPGH